MDQHLTATGNIFKIVKGMIQTMDPRNEKQEENLAEQLKNELNAILEAERQLAIARRQNARIMVNLDEATSSAIVSLHNETKLPTARIGYLCIKMALPVLQKELNGPKFKK